MLAEVEALPGVRVAQGSIEDHSRLVNADGKAIGSADEGIAFGIAASTADESLNPLKLVTGQWPQGDGQIAVDKSTADRQHFTVGQTVGAFGEGPIQDYRISGIVRFGSVGSIGEATITVFDLPTAQACSTSSTSSTRSGSAPSRAWPSRAHPSDHAAPAGRRR